MGLTGFAAWNSFPVHAAEWKPRMKETEPVVFVIDDDASMRQAIARLIRSVGLRVELFGSGREFLQSKRPHAPSCLVLDVRLPEMSGLEFQAELAKAKIHLPVIFITAHGDIPMSVRAMKAGAIEFLPKPFRDQDLLDAIQIGLERDRKRYEDEIQLADLQNRFESLTLREREVLPLMVLGWQVKKIATEIDVSEATVKVHRANVMRKMQAESLIELANIASRLGITLPKA